MISPVIAKDARGSFHESFRADIFSSLIGKKIEFVQDNLAYSNKKGTIRGLHGQKPPFAIGKLIQCIAGEVLDVCVDLRTGSKTYGKHIEVVLSAKNAEQLFVPENFAHGYETLCDNVVLAYKQTGYYSPEHEFSLRWNDKDIGIGWRTEQNQVILSDKDKEAPLLKDFESPF